MKNIGIKQQAVTIALIPILLMALFLESYGLYTRFDDLDKAVMERSKSLVRQLAASCEYAVFSGNADLLKQNINATLDQPDVNRVIVYDAAENVVMASSSKFDIREQPPIKFGLSSSLHDTKKSLWLYEPIVPIEIKLDELFHDVSSKSNVSKTLGGVLLEVSKNRLNDNKAHILIITLLITFCVLLLSVIVAFRLAHKITKPILELNNVIFDIGKGKLDTHISTPGVIELDQLANGVNSMAQLLLLDRNFLHARIEEATESLRNKTKQAEDASQAKSRFLAAASHDLRQPIAASSLFVDTLELTDLNPHQHKIVGRLKESMSSFSGLLNSLLDISKLDSGTRKPNFAMLDIHRLHVWVESNFQPLAENKGLRLNIYSSCRKPLVVKTDIDLIHMVMMNLVSNAIKFTSRGGILISARPRGSEVLLQIWDTGIGIAEENIEHIYDEFYQVGNPQRDRMAGLGLGLAIVKRSAELIGVKVTCQSRLGRGTVFSLCLPAAASDELGQLHPEIAIGNRTGAKSSLHGKRFVVVEDDIPIAAGLVSWLELNGGEVRHFLSAEEALCDLAIGHTDFYIADYMLSGTLNGIQFLNQLRQKFAVPIRAVLITGDTSTAFIKNAIECEWPVLHKPIDTSLLHAALEM